MTIVEFLDARLYEDERAAHAASRATGGSQRARADVAAKRKILQSYTETYRACVAAMGDGGGQPDGSDTWAALHAWRQALEHLAAAYDAHPDYDPSWQS